MFCIFRKHRWVSFGGGEPNSVPVTPDGRIILQCVRCWDITYALTYDEWSRELEKKRSAHKKTKRR